MNKIIRQAGVIGILVLAITIGAMAQSSQQYLAEIPFGFEAAGKHYSAGKYSAGPLSKTAPGGIAIRDIQDGNIRLLSMNSLQGDNVWDKPGTLNFLKVNGRYMLTQISTAMFKMKVRRQKLISELARGTARDTEVVAIELDR